jgi:hypothetical protein
MKHAKFELDKRGYDGLFFSLSFLSHIPVSKERKYDCGTVGFYQSVVLDHLHGGTDFPRLFA